ncbi:MAG: hypothetical protein IJR26_08630 [Bacteroidales bacterium]|nr:hypothetical protein [Bacteroidales bacterium]
MMLVSCSKEEPNEGSVNPTPGEETVSFVGTHWEGTLEFNDTVSGQVLHLKYLRTLEFYTDSTGLMEQTVLSPWNGSPTPFEIRYVMETLVSGHVTLTNPTGTESHVDLIYNPVDTTITFSEPGLTSWQHEKYDMVFHKVYDNYTPEQHAKFDRVFHKVNNNVE